MGLKWNYLVILILSILINRSNQTQQQQQQQSRHHSAYNYQNLQNMQPTYNDTSGLCPKFYYYAYRIVQNCSSLNLASNWPTLAIDQKFVTELLLLNNMFSNQLPYTQINNYYHLKLLDLSSNSISESTTDLQLIDCNANDLREINLNYNSFSRFPMLGVNCTALLQVLRLRNNNINTIDDLNVFRNPTDLMPNLKTLDLAYNKIEALNKNNITLLSRFPSLAYLNLIGNRIKYIQENPFMWTPNLMYLNVDSNQIQCESRLTWFKYFLINRATPIQAISPNGTQLAANYTPTCFSLLTQTDESIIDLSNSAFYSDIYLTTKVKDAANVNAMAGDTIDLDCSQFSVPPSDLWWLFNDRILSKIVTPGSPYQFIENFNSSFSPNNKTSVLRIKNIYDKLGGTYSCQAYYLNKEPNQYKNITSLQFKVNVQPNPNINSGSLSAGAIAGIVIGSILGFLLLCLLLFLCIWCCCYRRGLCCFKNSSANSSTSSSSSSNLYNKKRGTFTSSSVSSKYSMSSKEKQMSELEENQSGFKDINRSRPNYVTNTISKAGSQQNTRNTSMYPDSSGSWLILPNNKTDNLESNLNVSPRFNQKSFEKYDETLVYNVNNANLSPQHPHIYTIRHPVEYVSTNEAFLNDNNNLESNKNVRFNNNIDELNREIENYNVTNNNNNNNTVNFTTKRYLPANYQQSMYHNLNEGNFNTDHYNNQINIAHEIYLTSSNRPAGSNKQYISSNLEVISTNPNKIENNSYLKYDSDV